MYQNNIQALLQNCLNKKLDFFISYLKNNVHKSDNIIINKINKNSVLIHNDEINLYLFIRLSFFKKISSIVFLSKSELNDKLINNNSSSFLETIEPFIKDRTLKKAKKILSKILPDYFIEVTKNDKIYKCFIELEGMILVTLNIFGRIKKVVYINKILDFEEEI